MDFTVFFRSAYFEGQVEQPVSGLTSLITHQDIPVLVAINSKGLYIIDDLQCVSKCYDLFYISSGNRQSDLQYVTVYT